MKTGLSIRDFSSDDYDSLLELWKITELGGKERGDDLHIIMQTIDRGGRLLVMAGMDGSVIGSSWLSHDGRRMYIHHFAIHPDYQGNGLSKLLMDRSMDYCREVGLQVKIEVHDTNIKALNLYDDYGFKRLDDYGVYIIRNIKK